MSEPSVNVWVVSLTTSMPLGASRSCAPFADDVSNAMTSLPVAFSVVFAVPSLVWPMTTFCPLVAPAGCWLKMAAPDAATAAVIAPRRRNRRRFTFGSWSTASVMRPPWKTTAHGSPEAPRSFVTVLRRGRVRNQGLDPASVLVGDLGEPGCGRGRLEIRERPPGRVGVALGLDQRLLAPGLHLEPGHFGVHVATQPYVLTLTRRRRRVEQARGVVGTPVDVTRHHAGEVTRLDDDLRC